MLTNEYGRATTELEEATTRLLDWVANGKPGGSFAKKAMKKAPAAERGAGLRSPSATLKTGGGGKTAKATPTLKKSAPKKEPPKNKKASSKEIGAGAAGGAWTVTRELDSLGLGGEEASAVACDEGLEVGGDAFDDVLEADEAEEDSLDTISLVVVGHVDAGKSTLNGHLMYLLGEVDQRVMHKNEKEANQMGKKSFAFAWLMDGHAEERERGVTIDVGVKHVKTENRRVQLLDAPGHKDFVPSMISGACQADAAVLVIDGSPGEFESSFQGGGQVVEHAILVRSLGVQQLIVAINKLDTVAYSHDRFLLIQSRLSPFLTRSGYRETDVKFVPCSAYKGENLVKATDDALTSWYAGPTIVEAIDMLKSPTRPKDLPLRLSIADIFKTHSLGGCVAGRVEGGSLRTGEGVVPLPLPPKAPPLQYDCRDQDIVHTPPSPATETCATKTCSTGEAIVCRPGDLTGHVKAIEKHGRRVSRALAGDVVTVSFSSSMDMDTLRIGHILCALESPIPLACVFLAQIVVFDIDEPITKGYQATMYLRSTAEPVSLGKLLCTVNKSSGQVLKKKPRILTSQTSAVVQVTCQRPVCLEVFSEYKQLGRFTLRFSLLPPSLPPAFAVVCFRWPVIATTWRGCVHAHNMLCVSPARVARA